VLCVQATSDKEAEAWLADLKAVLKPDLKPL
jgi:hypothetical protein